MGAKLWYLSCPAVSQISNFTVASLTATVCEKNAAPIVDSCGFTPQFEHKQHRNPNPQIKKPWVWKRWDQKSTWNSRNWPLTNRRTRLDFPAPMSPNNTWDQPKDQEIETRGDRREKERGLEGLRAWHWGWCCRSSPWELKERERYYAFDQLIGRWVSILPPRVLVCVEGREGEREGTKTMTGLWRNAY